MSNLYDDLPTDVTELDFNELSLIPLTEAYDVETVNHIKRSDTPFDWNPIYTHHD